MAIPVMNSGRMNCLGVANGLDYTRRASNGATRGRDDPDCFASVTASRLNSAQERANDDQRPTHDLARDRFDVCFWVCVLHEFRRLSPSTG